MTAVQTLISTGAVLLLVIVAMTLARRQSAGARTKDGRARERNKDGSFPHTCAVCGDQTLVAPESLHALSSAEKALAVRARADALGRRLMEYVCRRCDASHCFAMEGDKAVFLGVNLYQGQQFSPRCAECQRSLSAPPWAPGAFDGRLAAAPGAIDGLGLQCQQCGAVCCVACCKSITRNRTPDGSLLCPRCFRGPQSVFFHPGQER